MTFALADDDTWTYTGPATSLAHSDSSVTPVEGQTFCLPSGVGDFRANAPHGLFVLDTRVLSRWGLRVVPLGTRRTTTDGRTAPAP